MKRLLFICCLALSFSCSNNDDSTTPLTQPSQGAVNDTPYFPPITGTAWETVSPADLNWNLNALNDLYQYLDDRNTRGFIILKGGKIVSEQYFNTHTTNAVWPWFSAVKSLTATAIGIAQDEGILNINAKSSDYLGAQWSLLSPTQQEAILVKHHLSMTTGLNDNINNAILWTCTDRLCMTYNTAPNTRWAYHQGAFTLLYRMLNQASGQNFKPYIKSRIFDVIGMTGTWSTLLNSNILSTNTRSMARFGLLALHKGQWEDHQVVSSNYFNTATNSSQTVNPAYGYLWWLNGKDYFVGTDGQTYNQKLIPNAPNDLFTALGANDQKIYVIPSLDMVIVRSGETAGVEQLANSTFDNELWGKLNAVFN